LAASLLFATAFGACNEQAAENSRRRDWDKPGNRRVWARNPTPDSGSGKGVRGLQFQLSYRVPGVSAAASLLSAAPATGLLSSTRLSSAGRFSSFRRSPARIFAFGRISWFPGDHLYAATGVDRRLRPAMSRIHDNAGDRGAGDEGVRDRLPRPRRPVAHCQLSPALLALRLSRPERR
jgi:hypothetical protein